MLEHDRQNRDIIERHISERLIKSIFWLKKNADTYLPLLEKQSLSNSEKALIKSMTDNVCIYLASEIEMAEYSVSKNGPFLTLSERNALRKKYSKAFEYTLNPIPGSVQYVDYHWYQINPFFIQGLLPVSNGRVEVSKDTYDLFMAPHIANKSLQRKF